MTLGRIVVLVAGLPVRARGRRRRRTAARQHHHRTHRRDQVPDQPGLVAGWHQGGVPVGRRRQAGPVRRHAGKRAGATHRLSRWTQICCVSDIGAFAWASNDEILFGKDGQLWTVAPSAARRRAWRARSPMPARSPCRPTGKQMAFVRRGQIWIASVPRRRSGSSPTCPTVSPRACRCSRPTAAGSRSPRHAAASSRGPAVERRAGALDGERHARAPARRRRGAWRRRGLDSDGRARQRRAVRRRRRGRLPGDVARRQDPRDQDGARRAALPRVLWHDRDDKWWSPTNRDAKLLVSPDGKSWRSSAIAADGFMST